MMKKLTLCFFTCAVLWQHAHGSDMQTGTTFSSNDQVTAAKLNNAVNNAVILPDFIHGKSSASPVNTDEIVFYQTSGGTLKKTTLSGLLASFFTSATFTGTTSISEATVISGDLTPTQIASDQNNYNPTGLATATTLRLSTDATRNITGIAGGAAGRILILKNVGSFNIVLNSANTGSTAANRFVFGSDRTIPANGALMIQYDATQSRWTTLGRQAQDDVSIAPAPATLTYAATTTQTIDPTKANQYAKVTLTGNTQLAFSGLFSGASGILEVTQDGTGSRKIALPGPSFTDGVGTTSTTFTSATASFVAADVGGPINESGNAHIPVGTTISSVSNSTTVVCSASVSTGTGITFYLPNRQSRVTAGGRGAVTLTTTAAATDVLGWVYNGTWITWTISKNAN